MLVIFKLLGLIVLQKEYGLITLNIFGGNMKRALSMALLLCPLIAACAKPAKNEATMVENQNNMTEMEHRLASLEQRVSTIDSNVQANNDRVYDVRNKSGRPTGWTAHPKATQNLAQTQPVAHVSPMSNAQSVPTPQAQSVPAQPVPVTPVQQAQVTPTTPVQQAPITQAPASYAPTPAPTVQSSNPIMTSAVTPDTSAGVLIKKKDAPVATTRAPMGSLDASTRMGATPPANASAGLSLPPESALYPPSQTPQAQSGVIPVAQATPIQAAPVQPVPVATPIVPVVNTNTQVNPSPVPVVQASTPPVAPAQPVRAVSGEQATYKAALDLVLAGKFNQGRDQFNTFLQQYPNGRLAPNAYYWIGESHYAQKNYPDALLSFKQVSTAYPKHHKTADALLKAGLTYEKLGDLENARLQFQAVVSDFPSSNAAKIARSKNF